MLRKNVTAQRRSHIDIVAEILHIARKGARKTRIVYGANLNFKLLDQYLKRLEKAGLVTRDIAETGIIKTTEKGKKYLQHYEGFKEFEIL